MKRYPKFAFVLLALILLLPACNKVETGIQGQVFLATCTGGVNGEIAVDCTNLQPFEATLTIYDENVIVVKTVDTKSDGTFIVELAPGTYYIHPQNNGGFPKAADFQVVVTDGEVVELTIQYDTGMR